MSRCEDLLVNLAPLVPDPNTLPGVLDFLLVVTDEQSGSVVTLAAGPMFLGTGWPTSTQEASVSLIPWHLSRIPLHQS